jgi:hypothetical protein
MDMNVGLLNENVILDDKMLGHINWGYVNAILNVILNAMNLGLVILSMKHFLNEKHFLNDVYLEILKHFVGS